MSGLVFPEKVVIDTNVLVSALWSKCGKSAQILTLILNDLLIPCVCSEIIQEYQDVLSRPHLVFHFNEARVEEIIGKIMADALSVVVKPSSVPFIDESDRVFYDVAIACSAYLITGNAKHFPHEPFILPPSQFLSLLDGQHFILENRGFL